MRSKSEIDEKRHRAGVFAHGGEYDEAAVMTELLRSIEKAPQGPGKGIQSCGFRAARDLTVPGLRWVMAEMERNTDPGAIADALIDVFTSLMTTLMSNCETENLDEFYGEVSRQVGERLKDYGNRSDKAKEDGF